MTINDYFRAFSDDELVHGAELYYSGELENIITKKNPAAKERLSFHDGYRYPLKETVSVTAKWNSSPDSSKAADRKAYIRIDDKRGFICDAECACDEFYEDQYGCRHTAALLTAYMSMEAGDDIFRGTRLETMLCGITNAEDPFQPGVLKRTDGRLLSLLQGNESSPLPVWKDDIVKTEPLKLSYSLYLERGRLMLELRIGSGKRMLLIKDLPGFLEAYRCGDAYSIGKSEFSLVHGSFSSRDAGILDFMSGLLAASEKGLYRAQLFASDKTRAERYMLLSGPELDSFMEKIDGTEVTVNEKPLMVELDRKGLKAVLKKKTYGATLRITKTDILSSSGADLYMNDKEGIFRVRTGSTEKKQELISMLKWEDELYIRESEIGTVFRNLLPVFQNYGNLSLKGVDPEDYEREKPEFIFNLDYPSEGVLSCIPYAVYRRQNFRCMLYDDVTDSSRRNASEESKVAEKLPAMFSMLDRKTGTLYSELDEDELFDFMREKLPELETLGKVMATDSVRRNRVRSLPAVSVGVAVESGHILLSLKGAGLTQSEMSDILSAYKRKKRYHRLKSGAFLEFEDNKKGGTWDTISELYREYGKNDPESMNIPAFRALYIKEALENNSDADLDMTEEYRHLVASMDPEEAGKSVVPGTLKDILRPYQTEGFKWIRMLKKCHFGGILADDMGLGKTLQIIAFILSEKLEGKKADELRTLVVCPASLVYNWQKEINMYAPELSSVVISGTAVQRKELIETSNVTDVWITSYDLLKRDIALYEKLRFANEVIDEAQFVKNQKTQAAQSVRLIDSGFRMALTGTPIENYLSELWSIMDYLMPGFLYSYSRFQSEYETPIVSQKDNEILDRLRRMVHPFILRRLKKQVLKELPDKLEEVVTVRMEGEQKQLYDASVEEIRLMLDSVSKAEFRTGKLEFLAKLTQLRQICCAPSLLYDNYKGESAKLEACMQLIDQAVSGGHKILLFSQFTTMLDIIGKRLSDEGYDYHRIDGGVSKEKRMELVDSFANDDVPVFLISLKAGGTGLNLTAADIVIHYDPWWNQAAQNQATDRTHRIGQTQTVTVYELIVHDTVEERIQKIKEAKSKLVEDVLSGGEISSTSLDKEDMLELLG